MNFNLLIWTFAPKHIYSRPKIVEIAAFLAVIIFNEDFLPLLKIMSVMGATIGQKAEKRNIFLYFFKFCSIPKILYY